MLFRGAEEVALQRQKSFDVLAYLVEHHGRLVTKAALMEAVRAGDGRHGQFLGAMYSRDPPGVG
jgi:DNA-binding winged helix-turn-helix (wHTH) protein